MIDFRQRAPRATRSNRNFTQARELLTGGAALCSGCRDTGIIPIRPEHIGEHSPRGVRLDLAAGNLDLCLCEMGEFWRTMLGSHEGGAR